MHFSLLLSLLLPGITSSYNIVDDFSGLDFFDRWDFYGNYDNLTLGDVVWLDEPTAFEQELALVNAAGNVIIKVDNFSNVPFNQKRNSVRITTQSSYDLGSLWVIDLVHLPFGCSVWPSIWTLGPDWPNGGEIDIIEGINLMPSNQYALHTTPGCIHTTPPTQTGNSTLVDCSQPSGCLVGELAPNSFQSGFAAADGGVYAAQFDYTGIFIWFWTRSNVPPSIVGSTPTSSIDLSDWGPPSASYVNTSCPIEQFFGPQKMVIDITLCGEWAGIPADYQQACAGAGPTGICYNDNVVGSGANYNDAYFEIKSVRTYTTAVPGPSAGVALGGKSNGSGSAFEIWWPWLLAGMMLTMM
ncbi:glycoside hydrolase family 16 protein [Roridomyces roridus]|uniref:Glycoside hydrolase family 16 protein n=1 Tax=Roridomyces roridus TaxID=1738132 RepID=A0AAD7FTX9_9AGAR|nr:glycoside hydrolase family 16 protein [Roridomyces roridus]